MNKIFSHFCFHVSTKYCSCSFLSSSPIYRRILSTSSFRKFIYIIRYINNLFSKCVSSSPFIQISHRQIQFIFDSLVCIPFFPPFIFFVLSFIGEKVSHIQIPRERAFMSVSTTNTQLPIYGLFFSSIPHSSMLT